MAQQKEIYNRLKNILMEKFEIDEGLIKPDAHLYEDLGLDSIDAVDMILDLKEYTGKKIPPEIFKNTRTVQDVVDSVEDLLNS